MTRLGIDCSSSKMGYALYDDETKTILHSDVILLDKIDSFIKKKNVIHNKLKQIYEEFNPEVVILEDILKQKGSITTANTLILLARMNGMLLTLLSEHFNEKMIIMEHPSTIRKKVIGKAFEKDKDTKMFVIDYITKKYKIKFKFTSKGNLKKGEDDRADAIILSMFSYN